MKRKIFIVLFALILIPLFLTTALRSQAIKTPDITPPAEDKQRKPVQPPDKPGTINGAQTPELIPDSAAYSIFLRVLSNRSTEAEKQRARAYVRQALGCSKCSQTIENGADVEAIIAAATEFSQKLGILDSKAKELKDKNWPKPNAQVISRLREMQGQKDAIVAELMKSLPTRLSSNGLAKLKSHIERMKRRMKIVPSPQSLPGGTDWKYHETHHDTSE